jgi:glycerol kinase
MQQDAGGAIRELRVDGGAAANNLLLQFQADLLRVPVVRPKVTEATALGAAYWRGWALANRNWGKPRSPTAAAAGARRSSARGTGNDTPPSTLASSHDADTIG